MDADYEDPLFEFRTEGITHDDGVEEVSVIIIGRDANGNGEFVMRFNSPEDLMTHGILFHEAGIDLMSAIDEGLDYVIDKRGEHEEDDITLTTEDIDFND